MKLPILVRPPTQLICGFHVHVNRYLGADWFGTVGGILTAGSVEAAEKVLGRIVWTSPPCYMAPDGTLVELPPVTREQLKAPPDPEPSWGGHLLAPADFDRPIAVAGHFRYAFEPMSPVFLYDFAVDSDAVPWRKNPAHQTGFKRLAEVEAEIAARKDES